MLNASSSISVQAIIMSVHNIIIHMYMYIHILCNLDAIIYNKITSIVNVIRLKLFTLISIVYKYGR